MRKRRRGRGFERAGALPAARLGLPERRTRQLDLAVAWRRVVGEVLSRRLRPVRIRRGVFEVELGESEPEWEEVARRSLPRLGGRLASARPDLGIVRVRLLRLDGGKTARLAPVVLPEVPKVPDEAAPDTGNAGSGAPGTGEPPPGPPTLETLMQRYLERGGERRRAAGRDAAGRDDPAQKP